MALAGLHSPCKHGMGRVLTVLVAVVAACIAGMGRTAAAEPRDDVAAANATVQRALQAARAGDVAAARAEYQAYEQIWFAIEDGVRGQSKDAYRAIEARMSAVELALAARPPAREPVVAALIA